MIYRQSIDIKKELLYRINGLLKIEDMEDELTEEELLFNPIEFDEITICDEVTFENGKSIYIAISSGDVFYYDDCYFIDDDDDNFLHLDYDHESDKPIKNELKIYHEYTDDVYIVSINEI